MSNSILGKIIWFDSKRRFVNDEFFLEGPKRKIGYHLPSKQNKGKSGSFYSSKNGCDMFYESQLEFKVYALLESSSKVSRFQSQPVRVKYGDGKVYYPDIVFYLSDGTGVICEVKPIKEMGFDKNWKKWKALKAFCMQEGYGLLITDGTTAISDLIKHELSEDYIKEVLDIIAEKKQVVWEDYYAIKSRHNTTWKDLTSLVIQHKLSYHPEPGFRIVDKNRSSKK